VGIAGATVSNVSLLDNNHNARFTISGATIEGSIAVSLAAGAISDSFGNPNPSAFNATYVVDQATGPFGALGAKLPLGSLIYEGKKPGIIGPAGDSDNFTLILDAGQTLSALAAPTTHALVP